MARRPQPGGTPVAATTAVPNGAHADRALPYATMPCVPTPLVDVLGRAPTAFGPVPFWFWNDDLDAAELERQLRAFHVAGCGGVIPHARVGLSRRVGYLTETFFQLLRGVVDTAAELGMTVILYDEGSYPSGSAKGRVAAANPDYVSRAIGLWDKEIQGPDRGFWRPNTGRALRDRHVVTVAGRCLDPPAAATADTVHIDPETLRVLTVGAHDVVAYDLPAGRWRLMSVWATDSGGHIRGAFEDEESGSATAPAAGDILNPDAVDCFLRLTHERYRQAVGRHFGRTITAMFTDEPGVFGKGPRRPADPRPYTPGFVDWLAECWGEDPRPWLPALWVDCGPGTAAFRARYRQAVESRLHEVFYAAQNRWCARHGLALTGHPGQSNDMASLRAFHLPGQDMVWRYVTPGTDTALAGAHSVAPKAATSGARRAGARRVLTEVCGAYGWRLTLDEVKWLFDWHLVRGNNLINPHAFFYSIRARRAWESEPDLGLHNVWWPHISHLLRYAGRLSWLLADAETVCAIAVLGDPTALPWRAAGALLRSQRDFTYVDPAAMARARVRDGRLHVGGSGYRAVVLDGDPGPTSAPWRPALEALADQGGLVIELPAADDATTDDSIAARLDAALLRLAPTVSLTPASPDLRATHVRKAGLDWFYLVNEGEDPVSGQVVLPATGTVEAWDPLLDARHTVASTPAPDGDGVSVSLRLERRQSVVLIVGAEVSVAGAPDAMAAEPTAAAPLPPARDLAGASEPESAVTARLDEGWTVHDGDGAPCDVRPLGDVSQQPGWELFSGTLCYRVRVHLCGAALLDLGQVGDVAEVRLDGAPLGVALWPPYRVALPGVDPGEHDLEIRVTNSMANEYEGVQRPSGLIGPVQLRPHAPDPSRKESTDP